MTIHVTGWDAADHLDSREAVLACLEAVLEDGDPTLIAAAVNDVARAGACRRSGAVGGHEHRRGGANDESFGIGTDGEGGVMIASNWSEVCDGIAKRQIVKPAANENVVDAGLSAAE